MRQEGNVPAELLSAWEGALTSAWKRAGLPTPEYTLEMPFYGDELNRLVVEVRGSLSHIVARGTGAPSPFTPLEEQLIREMAFKAGVTEMDARAELGAEVVAHGPANWEWVQAFGRLLERKVPALGGLSLSYVRQVDAYLTRQHIQTAVDDIVSPSLLKGPTVVIAHSLGSIIAFRLLREAKEQAIVPLLVTLGSPLGITAVKQRLQPHPLTVPSGVARWLNGSDERDYVALYSRLDRDSFAENIENISDLHNSRSDAHSIIDYLGDRTVAQRVHLALRAP
jgi:hypothetical protein